MEPVIVPEKEKMPGRIAREKVEVRYFDVLFKPDFKAIARKNEENHSLLEDRTQKKLAAPSGIMLAERGRLEEKIVFAMRVRATEISNPDSLREKGQGEILPARELYRHIRRKLEVLWIVPLLFGRYFEESLYARLREYYFPAYVRYKAKLDEPRMPGGLGACVGFEPN